MNQLLFRGDRQCAGHLECNVQGVDRFQRPLAFYTSLQGLSVDELHDVEIIFVIDTQIKDRGNVWVPERRGSARFAEKALARLIAFKIGGIDNLQANGKSQIRVIGFVGYPHGSPTKLPKATILPPE